MVTRLTHIIGAHVSQKLTRVDTDEAPLGNVVQASQAPATAQHSNATVENTVTQFLRNFRGQVSHADGSLQFYPQRCQLATTPPLSHSPRLYTLVTIIFTVFYESVTLWPESKGNREGLGTLGTNLADYGASTR